MLDKVEYLGTTISAAEISPTAEKVQAIKNAAPPTNVSELQSFLGSANFLRKFVPDFAKLASPLYGLLRKEVPWRWSKLERTLLITSRLLCALIRFYVTSVGVGAALLQPGPDGALQPVAYASRILNNAEQNYSQIKRASLAVVFGLTNIASTC